MTRLILLCILIAAACLEISRAESPFTWNGDYAYNLAPSGIEHNDGKYVATCSADPTIGAGLAAPIGSLCQYDSGTTGVLFLKTGVANTAWTDMLSAISGVPAGRTINTTTPLQGGGNLSANRTFSITMADSTTDGYLNSVDWNIFNNKQPAGNYITSLTGEVTASGPGAAAATIANDAVTNAKMANMAQATIKGRASGAGTGDPTDLTGTQATAILDTFTDSLKGLVPASGGGTSNFLRADGTFAAPTDTGITQLTGDVTAGPGSGSQATTIAANAVSNAKFRQSGALSVVGRSANSTGDVADISASNDGEILRRSGTALGFGTISTAGIGDDQVTLAKIADISNNTILSNISGSTANAAANSLSAIMDAVFSNTQGSVLYRNGSGWTALAPGTSGNFLQTQGAGANPQWAAASGGVTEYSWKGNHSNDCSWARSTASLGDPTADASCTFNQIENNNFGTVSSYLSGSDKLPGLSFTCPATGRFYVRASFNNTQAGSATNYLYDLYDGTTTVEVQRLFVPTGATGTRNAQLAGIYECTAAASISLRIRTESSDGASAFTITGNSPVNAVEWSIFKIQ